MLFCLLIDIHGSLSGDYAKILKSLPVYKGNIHNITHDKIIELRQIMLSYAFE